MADALTRFRSFLRELKRRNVYQVAAAYLVASFLVLQVASMAGDAFGLPGWFEPMAWVLCGLGLPLALVMAWAFELSPQGVRRTEGAGVETRGPAAGGMALSPDAMTDPGPRPEAGTGKSIAVLPFADMSPDGDQAYFADGLAEELLNALSQLGDLSVSARTSSFAYRDREVGVREIGRELGVRTVLEGSVRKAGDQLRVTAQLVDVRDGYHLWSDTFDRELEDVFAIQDEITASIVGALQVELLGDEGARLSRVGTKNPKAYDLYLKGRYYWQRRYRVGLDAALDFFQRALEEDPGFALSYAGIAEAYWALGTYGMVAPDTARTRAMEASERAVELGPGLAESYCARGVLRADLEYDLQGAMEDLERALDLDPQHARAEAWRALYLGAWAGGDSREAEAAVRRAIELAPESRYIRAVGGLAHLIGGRLDEAAEHLDRVLDDDPEMVLGLFTRALVHNGRGEHGEAVELLEKAAALTNRASFILALLGAVLGAGGRTTAARDVLAELEERAGREGQYVPPLHLATVEAQLGRREEALDHLARHAEAGYAGLGPFVSFGVLDVLRGAPRFDALLAKLEVR